MRVWLGNKASASSGGMYRVYEGLYTYLPECGIEIVADPKEADVLNPHIGIWDTFPNDKPVVISSHGMLWEENNWGRIASKVNRECLSAYRRAEVVTAPSQFVARAISRYTGASPFVVNHGIDTHLWVPQSDRQEYVLWNKARADSASDPEEMNRLAELADDTLFYSTHGRESNNVYIFGNVSPDDMRDVVANSGIYLSLSKESGGPCFGILEAMASGVCVLAWDFGGTAEVVVHKETGYLAKPHDYDDLLAGLRYCQEHKKRLGDNARQLVVDNYQWKDTILGYVDAYDAALYGWNDTVSVIVPCYNLAEFLPHCLDSVLDQTYTNLEVVVIDDASTDNSWQIIQEYAQKDYRIVPIQNTTNQHVSYSRNIGVQYAVGNFILPLDADDRLYPDAVEIMVQKLRNSREFDIAAGRLHIYHESALEGPFQASGWPNNASLKLQLEGYNRLPYSSMYRRKVFDRVGGYRTRIRNGVEDADFWTRALSLGYKAVILDDFTLKYTHREQSLGKTNDKGAEAWLAWFPYTEETSPALASTVSNFCPPKVSVVIPVGPGHAQYVQSCIDSVWAQTEPDWEIVLVNDTGELLENIPGFVNYVTYPKNMGVAYARNQGVQWALSDKIVFLDVDDTLQPHALQSLLAAHEYAGGWIYGDWYINKGDGKVEYSESKSWDYDLILQQSLGPITGLYEKEHILLVDGFDETLPGWEDWDFQLKLLHHGICGTRLKTPLITYNMHLGWRREDNFKQRNNLLKYIQEKHYKVLKGKKTMACNSCGGRKTLTISQQPSLAARTELMEDLVQVKYLGNNAGRERIDSKTHKGTNYNFSTNKREGLIFKSDLDRLLNMRFPDNSPVFEVVKEISAEQPMEIVVKEEPLVSQDIPVNLPVPIEHLELEEHVVDKLHKGGIKYIAEIMEADDAQLTAIRGIGDQRVEEIRGAVNTWLSS